MIKTSFLIDVLKLLKNYKVKIFLTVVFAIIFILINIYKPFILSLLFDEGINKGSFSLVYKYTIIFFVIMILTYFLSILYEYILSNFANNLIYEIRTIFISHIMDLPYSFFEENSTGDVTTRIGMDIEDIRDFILFDTSAFYQSVLAFIGTVLFMGISEWRLLLANLLILPSLYFLLKYFKKIIYKISREVKDTVSESNEVIIESFKYINEFKASGFELYLFKNIKEKYIKLLKIFIKSSVFNKTSNQTVQLLINYTYLVTIGYGGYLIINGSMSQGLLLAFLTLRSNLISPIQAWGNLYSRYQTVRASFDRLNQYYCKEKEKGINIPYLLAFDNISNSGLKLENLKYSYSLNVNIINNFSLIAIPGDWIGISGPSGIGKTTLFKLLLKIEIPSDGSILLNGFNSEVINNRQWREKIGYLSQTPSILNDTIANNILMGRDGIEDEKLWDVLDICCLKDDILKLAMGLNSKMNENGSIFSIGMLKRLMLARILINEKQIFLLDELFSSLDIETSLKIQSNLKKYLPPDTIVFIISHRQEDFVLCNKSTQLINIGNEIIRINNYVC